MRDLESAPTRGRLPAPLGERGHDQHDAPVRSMMPQGFDQLVQAHLDRRATEADLAVLAAHEDDWIWTLEQFLDTAEAALERVRSNVWGPERELVLADFQAEVDQIEDALDALLPEPEPEPEPEPPPPGPLQLQLSWTRGRIVAWAGGYRNEPEPSEQVLARLAEAGAPMRAWEPADAVPLPDGPSAESVSASIESTLGWLATLATGGEGDSLGPSARWLGAAAALAVRLAAQGRMVPQLEKMSDGPNGQRGAGRSTFAVQWVPALIDRADVDALARGLPASVAVLERLQDPRAFIEAVTGDFLNVICHDAAGRVEVPASPPDPRSEQEVAEAVLAGLDGAAFNAPTDRGNELTRNLRQWARSVVGTSTVRLIVQLDPPDEGDAWHLKTLTSVGRGQVRRVDSAMANAPDSQRQGIKRELDRLKSL